MVVFSIEVITEDIYRLSFTIGFLIDRIKNCLFSSKVMLGKKACISEDFTI